jgi:aryl-alcohol dehydrogenase-like predicted oxidoreductase
VVQELRNLNTDRIDFLQWLFRSEPIDDSVRLPRLIQQQAEVQYGLQQLVKEGLVGVVGSFPYTIEFGEKLQQLVPAATGWITYFNILEQENLKQLPEDFWMIGLRPLAAGKAIAALETAGIDELRLISQLDLPDREVTLAAALQFCLDETRISTHVLSINSLEKAAELSRVLKALKPLSTEQKMKRTELFQRFSQNNQLQ